MSSAASSARCMWMRGGTSKGGYFLGTDLPADVADRDAFLLSVMGSPDARQVDGMGGADPLTSKVAVVSKSQNNADIDYLFLQVSVDQALVSDAQNCGNILAGVAPFAIERGLVAVSGAVTQVRVFMVNTGQMAVISVATPDGAVTYAGGAKIDGVPGTAAAVSIAFADIAGASCGALLPSGNAVDVIEGIEVTLIDNGMPCVVLCAADMGITGRESRADLEGNAPLRAALERIRLIAGPMMNLGDVTEKTVPKMTMVSAPDSGGVINTRTFIPHRCHASIGVLGAVSVATACLIDGSVAANLAVIPQGPVKSLQIEHPIGETTIVASVDGDVDGNGAVTGTAILRTARKLFDGVVFVQ
ncbi:MAG: 4-oxalomesaconate tautomerase [Rhodobacterales bacterium]|nr:4-oxalomesaconate tautomerase [Rhodobacterales bacterium]